MNGPSLPEKVIAIDGALTEARIAHAFGGALALAYYAEPRATVDIDINLFVKPADADRVEGALAPLGVEANSDRLALERDGQSRWRWGETPVDLFFNNDPIHDAMKERVRRVPFADRRIPVLAPEHLLICKVAFDRPKDWLDIEQMLLLTPDMDRDEIDRWLARLLSPEDPRHARLTALMS